MGFSLFFQLVNSVLFIGIIYIFFYLIFILPKQMKMNAQRLEQIEVQIREINEKLDRQ
ncbi:hypothetical protein [Geosporobacter ferrireducens]|uniref:hypothetical protein n=1 Tax=Geosporobacter ferrireducens TaxID=1424294 RepID=UPI0012EA21E4|nr:hypothetical protein [Geosporobacter ferrireducens]